MAGKRSEIERVVIRALRHDPEALDLKPDRAGYCPKRDVLRALQRRGFAASPALLEEVFQNQRFGFDPSGTKVRADYGTSLGLSLADMYSRPDPPPPVLYHGSSQDALDSIKAGGILRVGRRGRRPRDHVFLTTLPAVALKKGTRYGRGVAIPVRALEMDQAGFPFYHAKDDIWLTDHVPPEFLDMATLIF